MKALKNWPLFQRLHQRKNVSFKPFEARMNWTSPDFFRDGRLTSLSESLKPLKLESYDLVVSDNFLEAVLHNPNTIILSSFLWHEVYRELYPNEPQAKAYSNFCEKLLKDFEPEVLANRYFATPSLQKHPGTKGVGMLPPIVHFSKHWDREKIGILFSGGSHSEIFENIRSYLEKVATKTKIGKEIQIFLDKPLYKAIPYSPFYPFDYDKDSFDFIDSVVARPGMGTITECIGTQTPLFCYYESNFEMEFNAKVLQDLGAGFKVSSLNTCLEQILSFLNNPHAQRTYTAASQKLDQGGLEQCLSAIRNRLGNPQPKVNNAYQEASL